MKKTLALVLVLALSALLLCSCAGSNNPGNDSADNSGNDTGNDSDNNSDNSSSGEEPEDEEETPDGVIFTESTIAALIYNSKDLTHVVDAVRDTQTYIRENFSRIFVLFNDTYTQFSHEIVFGDTTRAISAEAKAALNAKLESKKPLLGAMGIAEEDMAGYMVYSNGSSVAIVWTHFQLAESAIEYFCENYLNANSLTLEAGHSSSEFLSLDAFLRVREDRIMEEKWAALEAAIPEKYREEIITELHRYYSLFEGKDDSLVDWLASLYDVETGAWYGTESAKNTPDYLPDIEHTYQALQLLEDTGMAEMFGGDWVKAMPRDILEKAGYWVQSLQDADGYYYHPQWPKDYIEKNGYQLRITRDKDTAYTLLKAIGIPQKYAGYVTSEDNLIGNLGGSTALAVSKVVAASALLDEYKSTENFQKYLDEFEASLASMTDAQYASAFYTFSSHFQTTVKLMNADMRRMTVEFFDRHQNPENGMWSEGLHYASTNAIHKTVSVYNQLGAEVKYAEKIVESTLEILKWDVHTKPTSTAYDLYNVWTVFPYLYQNIRNCAPGTATAREERCAAIKELVYEGVADAIFITYEQMKDYSHSNGSGSIYRFYSLGASSAMCPTAVPYTREGSIAGFLTVDFTMPYYILAALELEDYIVPIFTEQDRVAYISKLRNAEPTVKGALSLSAEKTHTFEDITIGEVPGEISVAIGSGKVPNADSYIKVSDNGAGNRVLEFNATSRIETNGRNYNATLLANHTEQDPNAMLLKLDLKLNSGNVSKNITEFLFYAGNTSTPVFQISIGLDASGNVYVSGSDGAKIGNIGSLGEYIKLSIVYEWDKGEYSVYADDTPVGTGSYTFGGTAKHAMVGNVNIGSVSTTTANYFFDNICFKTHKTD